MSPIIVASLPLPMPGNPITLALPSPILNIPPPHMRKHQHPLFTPSSSTETNGVAALSTIVRCRAPPIPLMRCATLGSPIDTADHRPPLPDSSCAASLSLSSSITTTKPRAASYFNQLLHTGIQLNSVAKSS
ncbi:hypothetical protein ACS0TY_017780 [Phlomoides rotata]